MFSKELRRLRIEKNIKQKDLADKIGRDQRYISKLETGVIEPNLESLIKIANVFECSVDYLLGRESEDGYIIIGHDSPTEQSEIERLYYQLDKYQQARVLGYIESLLNSTNSQTKNNA